VEHEERNPRPEETVDRLEAAALDTEAPDSKELTDSAEGADDSTEPAFDQDLDVEDLPCQGSSATEPSD
jgi:hypothetical protein